MSFPLTLVEKQANALEARRSCGPCTACCVLPRISAEPDFPSGKPGYVRCDKLCATGCSVYDDRPELCRDYVCLWRVGIVNGDERRRPDRLGLMFTLDEMDGKPVIEAWELWEGAATNHPGRGVIDRVYQKFDVQVRFYGVPCSINLSYPQCYELGRYLSEAARIDPVALARWCDHNVLMGTLQHDPSTLESAMRDLQSLRDGVPIERHYTKPN